ncbi:hypothetical protein HZA86_01820 [Candidatus Uhrbacteria bacterium]|nr:hypothetical protein [Candidatus Uhrbacteria bacterium]
MPRFITQLRDRITHGPPRTVLFPEAGDERVLEAANILAREGIVRPLLICESRAAATLETGGLDSIVIDETLAYALQETLRTVRSSKVGTADELHPDAAFALAHDPLFYGMYLLRMGKADGLVAGAVRTTADVGRAGLWLIGKAPGIQTVSSAMYMVVPPFRATAEAEVLTFADCAVVPDPSSEQLADIAIASADARSSIVGDAPRVAMLSYSTKGSGGDRSSTLALRKAMALVREKRPDIMVDGELQADAALVKSIADRKAPGSSLSGAANVLIFPSLDAANIAYKLVATLVPGAQAIGPILQGFAKPMSDLSRGATVEDIVSVATIVAAQVPSASSS